MLHTLYKIVEFLFVSVIFKYIILKWVAEQIMRFFKWIFVRTERDIAIWKHYRSRALKEGHESKSPLGCGEDSCSVLQ
jgi:hypothetical protein